MSACCKGFMVVNAFLHSQKFTEIYYWLKEASETRGLLLDVYTNAELTDSKVFSDLKNYDFCLFWDKDIPLARKIEAAGIRCFNSARAIEICDDKWATYEALYDKAVPMPDTIFAPMTYENIGYTSFDFLSVIEKRLGYPYVLKECHGSFGAQVYLINNEKEAKDKLALTGGRSLIFQKYLKECRGHDIRINMVGDSAVCAMERYNDEDFRANVTAGGKMKPHDVTEAELLIARRVMNLLKLDFAGIDLLLSDSGHVLCEVNSNAHFKNIYDCTGVNVAEHIMDYIKNSR